MTSLVRRVSEWGIRSDTSAEQAHHYRLTNVLLLFMFFASFFETAVCFFSGGYQAALINLSAPFVFGGGLLLMKTGRTVIARVFVLSISNVMGYAMIAALGPQSYFQFIFLFASAFSVVFFSSSEKVLLIVGMAAPLACFVTLELTDFHPVLGMVRGPTSPGQYQFMRICSMVVIWFIMASHFAYSIKVRKKLQAQLVSSAKMVALGRMAAGIAHEVNNPLQLIVSQSERLAKIASTSGSDEVRKSADQILSVAMRIGAIVKGLLAIARDSTMDQKVPLQLTSLFASTLDYSRARLESKNILLRQPQFPMEWATVGAPTQLSEVILNLIDNAYDAVLMSDDRWIEIEVRASSDWLDVVVSDSGHGVDPKYSVKIFEPFFTTKSLCKGTGLGLSVSQAIIAAHGGQIFLDSSSAPTRFVVRLPRGPDMTQSKLQIELNAV